MTLSIIRLGISSCKFYSNLTPHGTDREVYNPLLTITTTPHGTNYEMHDLLLINKAIPHGTNREVCNLCNHFTYKRYHLVFKRYYTHK